MSEFPFDKRKIDVEEILNLLVEGSLYHSNHEVRSAGVKLLEAINRLSHGMTAEWYRKLRGLKPNIAVELEEKLKIK